MRVKFLLSSLFLCFALSGMAQDWEAFIEAFSSNGEVADTLEMDEYDSLELSELTFRFLMKNNQAVKPAKSKYYILSFLHCAQHLSLNPDGPLMIEMQDVRPKVRNTMYYFQNKKKLEGKVMFFFITEMEMVTPDIAQVKGGYYQSDDACRGHIYRYKRESGVWELQRSVIEWEL